MSGDLKEDEKKREKNTFVVDLGPYWKLSNIFSFQQKYE